MATDIIIHDEKDNVGVVVIDKITPKQDCACWIMENDKTVKIQSVDEMIDHGFDIAGGYMDQRIPIFAPSFNQCDMHIGVFAQTVGQDAASRSPANNDVVCLHVIFQICRSLPN